MIAKAESTTGLINELTEAERTYAVHLVDAIINFGATDRDRYVDAILELCRMANIETAVIIESLSLGTHQPDFDNSTDTSLSPAMILPHEQWLDGFEHGVRAVKTELS